MKQFRPKPSTTTFRFPFKMGPRSLATGSYNAPPSSRPSKSAPPIKQFTALKPGLRKKQQAK